MQPLVPKVWCCREHLMRLTTSKIEVGNWGWGWVKMDEDQMNMTWMVCSNFPFYDTSGQLISWSGPPRLLLGSTDSLFTTWWSSVPVKRIGPTAAGWWPSRTVDAVLASFSPSWPVGWLLGWLDGWPVCSPVRQTGSHCGNLDSNRPTNRRSGFIPVMRRWAVEKRKCLEAVESWTKPQLDGWWGGKNGCMSKHNIWYGGYLWISKCWLKWTNF